MVILLASSLANAQLSPVQEVFKDVQEIVFDTSGRIISYPKTFITSNTSFKFKVVVPANAYQPWISMLQENLKKTKKYFEREEVKKVHRCLLTDSAYADFNLSANSIISLTTPCDRKNLQEQIRKLAIKNKLIPIKQLIENVERQYQVKIYRNEICTETITLTFNENCEGQCVEFSSKSKKVKKVNCTNCVGTESDQFRFELIRINPWDQTIRDWYREKAAAFKEDNKFADIEAGLTTLSDTSNPLDVKDAISQLVPLQRWFINWFWFNGGALQLDPFNVLPETTANTVPNMISEIDTRLAFLHEKLVFLDSAKRALTKTRASMTELETIQAQQKSLMDEIATESSKKTVLVNSLRKDPLLLRLNYNALVYQGRMELSKSIINRRLNPHKQYDALKGFRPISLNYFQRRKISEIPENERMHIAVHNVPLSVTIKADEKRQPFTDQEEFTALLSEQLAKIDFSGLGVPLVRNMEDFFRSFGNVEVEDLGTKSGFVESNECVDILKVSAKNLLSHWKEMQVTFPVDPNLFKKLGTTDPAFRTHLAPLTEFEAPFRDSITIKAIYPKDSVVDVAKTYVKVGKLRFFQLMAGVAVMKNPVPVTRIDTVGGGFRVSSSDNAARAIFGFKIYPFKNYNRDHGLLPRYPLRRFSFFAGAELLKPLDNFYLGGAYDVIPGLAVSMGSNISLQTTYQVQNNAIVKTSRRYRESGRYYAVSVNPVLFVQFVKLFFK
ncbi:hypothetical protein [Flaviaesturariibacter amylovorans]|uniref:Bacterial surface antigen (D15) domain-containing protein n=1 Tax=Flaviaesturariibacter amylovorans TaxID=1084520 RepID=A0ABP8G7I1_9BACT